MKCICGKYPCSECGHCNCPEWIKCSERLPEIDQNVVFYNKSRDFCYCGYFCEVKGFRENLDDWWFEDEEITHWMPIEHPPKDLE